MSDQMKADRATPLPCPFCGKQPVLQRCMEEYEADDKFPAGEYEAGVLIICTECGIEMGDEYRSEVVERWNTRAALMQQAADEAVAKNDGADLRRARSLAFDAAKAFVRDDRTPMSTKLTAGTPGFLTALHDAILGAVLKARSAPAYEQGVAAGLEMAAKVAEDKAQQWDGPRRDGWHACNDTADAIRALADQHKPSPAEEPMP